MNQIETLNPSHKRMILSEIKLNSLGNRSKKQKFWLAFKRVCSNYVENTQVHGFVYLRDIERKGFTRVFWSLVIIISFLFGAYILAELITEFVRVPFQITVGSPEQLMSIPYPAISICHPQTVVNSKAKEFVDEIEIPDGYNKADIIDMLPVALGIFTENQWGSVDANHLITVNEILQLNGLSVLDAVKAVGIKCPEFVIRCSFNKQRFPCFQDDDDFTFRETVTHIGICCSFNYNPTNDSHDPVHINSYGVRGGLSIIGTSFPHSNDGNSGILFSDGFILFMHSPYDNPNDDTSRAFLEVGKITSIGIYPTISTMSTDVRALPLQSRKCLIGSDVNLKHYRRSACATRCLITFIYDKCGCHPYYLQVLDSDTRMPDCTVLDGECFQKNFYDMKKIRCSSCLPACENVEYKLSSATISYSFANTSINPMYDQTNVTTSEFTAHIYFAGSTVPVRKTIISQSLIALMSNFGGIFNLVLGVSVFSILELFYYFCFKIPQFMKKHKRVKPVITYIQPENIFR